MSPKRNDRSRRSSGPKKTYAVNTGRITMTQQKKNDAGDIPSINRFRGEYRFLSNFYEAEFEYEGIIYPTSEHAYQERKTNDPETREWIRSAETAMECAIRGRSKRTKNVMRKDWFDIKGEVMHPIVREKFRQNPELARKLIETRDATLIEGNYWHDNYFGVCTCKKCHSSGQALNMLGNILMNIRESMKEFTPEK